MYYERTERVRDSKPSRCIQHNILKNDRLVGCERRTVVLGVKRVRVAFSPYWQPVDFGALTACAMTCIDLLGGVLLVSRTPVFSTTRRGSETTCWPQRSISIIIYIRQTKTGFRATWRAGDRTIIASEPSSFVPDRGYRMAYTRIVRKRKYNFADHDRVINVSRVQFIAERMAQVLRPLNAVYCRYTHSIIRYVLIQISPRVERARWYSYYSGYCT